jgi:GTP cyclohydrolase I
MTPLTEAEIKAHARKILDLIGLDTNNRLLNGTPVNTNNTLHLISAAYSLGCLLTQEALTPTGDEAEVVIVNAKYAVTIH